ncbi:exonuclease SbcCD subunit D [Chungangia koreensis]|uniref:Exonuclease SbcCD subunit D n=1 Tax=Chungangia koreensis TaxID=752657 RepID=A0ABV8X6K6_9LACT
MTSIRFIHTADLHLDSPFKGMTELPKERLKELRDSTFNAFDRLISYALKEQPDFIVIAGDVYDGEDRSLRAQQRFHDGMEKLNKAGIPVFLCHGNHDHLGGRWVRFDLPPNVRTFGNEVTEQHLQIRGQDVFLIGFSYPERHVTTSMIDTYPIAERNDAIHIGLLHGSIAGDSTHAVYAPFTKEQLVGKQYDYWALGHIHKRQFIHRDPYIVYPGNLQSRHRNERGIKGFYDVTLEKGSTDLSFIPASSIVFDEIHVSCQDIHHANELLLTCSQEIEKFRSLNGAGVCDLVLTEVSTEVSEMLNTSTIDEWLRLIRETEEEQEPFVWVSSIEVDERVIAMQEVNAVTHSVINLMNDWSMGEWKEVVSDVYQHTKGIRYLEPLNEQDLEDIKRKASSILMKEMAGME